jgi:hypothetical protein
MSYWLIDGRFCTTCEGIHDPDEYGYMCDDQRPLPKAYWIRKERPRVFLTGAVIGYLLVQLYFWLP